MEQASEQVPAQAPAAPAPTPERSRPEAPAAPAPAEPQPAAAPTPAAPVAAAPTPAAPSPAPTLASAPASTAAPAAAHSSGRGNMTNGTHATIEEYNAKFLFDKMLTSSDAGGHGRVVIPKVHARAHLPNLDEKGGMHLECVDTFGHKHRFRYCSWINNSSRMYLLEGVAPALNNLKLKAGDILIFGQLASGEVLLGGRARTAADKDRKAPPRARKSEEGGKANGGPSGGGVKRPRAPAASSSGGQRARASGTAAPFRPPCDGVFRAVPPTFNAREYCGKILQQAGAWTAILDLAGEAYQAFFDSQGAAFEALNAAGVPPPKLPYKQPAPAQAAPLNPAAAFAAAAAAAAQRPLAMPAQPMQVQQHPPQQQPMAAQQQPMAAQQQPMTAT